MFWRVLLSSCSNCGVLLSWVSWPGGSVEAGETARAGNFETSNPLTECQKSTQRGTCVSVVLPSYFGTIKLDLNELSRYDMICILLSLSCLWQVFLNISVLFLPEILLLVSCCNVFMYPFSYHAFF